MREVDSKVGTLEKGKGLYLWNGRMGTSGGLGSGESLMLRKKHSTAGNLTFAYLHHDFGRLET